MAMTVFALAEIQLDMRIRVQPGHFTVEPMSVVT
jgi:hypothetical protein